MKHVSPDIPPLCISLVSRPSIKLSTKISGILSHNFNGQFLIPLPHRQEEKKDFSQFQESGHGELSVQKQKTLSICQNEGGDLSPWFEGGGVGV